MGRQRASCHPRGVIHGPWECSPHVGYTVSHLIGGLLHGLFIPNCVELDNDLFPEIKFYEIIFPPVVSLRWSSDIVSLDTAYL